jgi:hypothetical protein
VRPRSSQCGTVIERFGVRSWSAGAVGSVSIIFTSIEVMNIRFASSPSAKHLIECAIEARDEGKRKRMRREALRARWWLANRSRGVEQLKFWVDPL